MKLHYGDLVDGKALPLHFKHVSFLNYISHSKIDNAVNSKFLVHLEFFDGSRNIPNSNII